MGLGYSYLRIKVTNYTIGIIFIHNDNYQKFTIAAGHPDNSVKRHTIVNRSEYNSYGDWYYYDGKSEYLYEVLSSFNPHKDNIQFLVDRLKTECNIQKYRSTWSKIMEWVQNIIKTASGTGIIYCLFRYFMKPLPNVPEFKPIQL